MQSFGWVLTLIEPIPEMEKKCFAVQLMLGADSSASICDMLWIGCQQTFPTQKYGEGQVGRLLKQNHLMFHHSMFHVWFLLPLPTDSVWIFSFCLCGRGFWFLFRVAVWMLGVVLSPYCLWDHSFVIRTHNSVPNKVPFENISVQSLTNTSSTLLPWP